MLIELVNARNKYGDFWTHGAAPVDAFFKQRTSWFKDLSYEAAIIRKILSGDYAFFLDIGAGWGYHTIIAAHNLQTVVAIESNALRFGLMCWNTQLLKNVTRIWAFVGKEEQRARRSSSPYHPIEAVQPEIDIEAVTIDSLMMDTIAEKPRRHIWPLEHRRGLVKIDVEGCELEVLSGATKLLKDNNFDWIVEVHERVGIASENVDAFMTGKAKERLAKSGATAKHFFYQSRKL